MIKKAYANQKRHFGKTFKKKLFYIFLLQKKSMSLTSDEIEFMVWGIVVFVAVIICCLFIAYVFRRLSRTTPYVQNNTHRVTSDSGSAYDIYKTFPIHKDTGNHSSSQTHQQFSHDD